MFVNLKFHVFSKKVDALVKSGERVMACYQTGKSNARGKIILITVVELLSSLGSGTILLKPCLTDILC